MQRVGNPVPLFLDATGRLLDGGKIYLGVVDGDPQTDPIDAFWDSALTIPAAQPIRTLGGFIVNGVNPASVFVAEDDFSMRVLDSLDNLVEYSSTVLTPGVTYLPLLGGTMLGELITAASTLSRAGFRMPHGVAPTSPVNGQTWTTLAGGLHAFIDSSIRTYADLSSNQTLANKTLASVTIDSGTINAGPSIGDDGTITAFSPGFRGMPDSGATVGATISISLEMHGKKVRNTLGGWDFGGGLPDGFWCTCVNDSGSSQNVTSSAATLRLSGTALTGTRAVAQRGMATVVVTSVTSGTELYCSGAGVS